YVFGAGARTLGRDPKVLLLQRLASLPRAGILFAFREAHGLGAPGTSIAQADAREPIISRSRNTRGCSVSVPRAVAACCCAAQSRIAVGVFSRRLQIGLGFGVRLRR